MCNFINFILDTFSSEFVLSTVQISKGLLLYFSDNEVLLHLIQPGKTECHV